MKYSELNNKNKEELTVVIKDLKEKLLNLKFDLADRKLKNTSQIGMIKKDLARALTALEKLNA